MLCRLPELRFGPTVSRLTVTGGKAEPEEGGEN
jgi:hypothetical protein